MRGADMFSVRQGGEPLHMDAEQSTERLGLGLAQLGELGSNVLNRAVTLAELGAGGDAVQFERAGAGSVAVAGQRLGQGLGPALRVEAGSLDRRPVPLFQVADPLAGEPADGGVAGELGQEPQRRGGQMVVLAAHLGVAGVGGDEVPGGTPPAPPARHGALADLDPTSLEQRVEMTADRGLGQPQGLGQPRGADRTLGKHLTTEPVPGPVVQVGVTGLDLGRLGRLVAGVSRPSGAAHRCVEFHYTIVALFARALKSDGTTVRTGPEPAVEPAAAPASDLARAPAA